MDVFWDSHSPTVTAYSQQYKSIIFYHNDEQKRLATEAKEQEENRRGREIKTEITPFTNFYLAENYHQKYYLKQDMVLAQEFSRIYPDPQDFINSTAVARANGYIGGYGNPDTYQETVDSLGLSAAGVDRLLKIAGRGLTPVCGVP